MGPPLANQPREPKEPNSPSRQGGGPPGPPLPHWNPTPSDYNPGMLNPQGHKPTQALNPSNTKPRESRTTKH